MNPQLREAAGLLLGSLSVPWPGDCHKNVKPCNRRLPSFVSHISESSVLHYLMSNAFETVVSYTLRVLRWFFWGRRLNLFLLLDPAENRCAMTHNFNGSISPWWL